MRYFAYIICLFLFSTSLNAQFKASVYTDMGESNVSAGFNLKASASAGYKLNKFELTTAFQSDIISNNTNMFSGWNIKLSKDFNLTNFNFNGEIFYLWAPYSDLVRETNYGLLLSTKKEHFNLKIGTNFRTLGYTQKAINEFGFSSNTDVHDNFNLMYALSYDINKAESPWNAGLTVTNFDQFKINQEMNPYWNLHGYYDINEPIRLFGEAWYETAGSFNLHVNYFGFFIRTGIIYRFK